MKRDEELTFAERRRAKVLRGIRASVRDLQGIGSAPYGILRLALNYLRSADLPLLDNRKAVGDLRECLRQARVHRCEASLLDLEAVGRRMVYRNVDAVCAVVCANAKRLFRYRGDVETLRAEMTKTVRMFVAKRNLVVRLLEALDGLHGSHRHGVVHWRGKGVMPRKVLDEVVLALRVISREDNLAYMLDSSAKGGLHVHYLCSSETERRIKERLRDVAGVQATSAPKALVAKWEEREARGFPMRDTTSYLAVKLTPGLQIPGIARKVKEDLGGVGELGRVVCHPKANRLALEGAVNRVDRPVSRDSTAALIQRGRELTRRGRESWARDARRQA